MTAEKSHDDASQSAHDRLIEIATCDNPTTRAFLVDAFLRDTEPMTKGIAAGLCRYFKADRNTWLDEFCQIVRITSQALVEELASDAEKAAEVESYKALLTFRARSAGTKFVDSSAGFNQASGMAGAKRRVKELERTRIAMIQQGLEPTDEEIVEETNRRMMATRRDAARQGMICTIDDLRISEFGSNANIEDHAHPVSVDSVETDGELHSTERVKLIFMCIAACDEENEQLGQIARMWFAPALDENYSDHPTAAMIAEKLGIEPVTARTKVAKVKAIARHVARERFGIRTGEDQ